MDEVKKWDLQQLPGYEAIEEEPEEPEDFLIQKKFKKMKNLLFIKYQTKI